MSIKELYKKYKPWILIGCAMFGITPGIVVGYLNKLKQDVKHYQTSNQVYNAAFRALYRLDYTGLVKIDGETVNIEIRSTYTYDDFKKDMLLVEWVFVIYEDRGEMYEAIYSGIWRSYHFIDKNKKYRWVTNLKAIE